LADKIIVAAAHVLVELSPALKNLDLALLPDIQDARETNVAVAMKVIQQCTKEGLNRVKDIPENKEQLRKWMEEQMWRPQNRELEKVSTNDASREAKGKLGTKGRPRS
jgi:malic enzyme